MSWAGLTLAWVAIAAPTAELELWLPPQAVGICVSGGDEAQRDQLYREAARVVAARRDLAARRVNLPAPAECDRARLVSCWSRRLETEPLLPRAIVWLSIEEGRGSLQLTAAHFDPNQVLALDEHQPAAELEGQAQAALRLLEPVPWAKADAPPTAEVAGLIDGALAAMGLSGAPPTLVVRHDCFECRLHLDGQLLTESAPPVVRLLGIRPGRRQVALRGASGQSATGDVEVNAAGAELRLSASLPAPPVEDRGTALGYFTLGAGGAAVLLAGLAVVAGTSGPVRSCVAAPCPWRYARLFEDSTFAEAPPRGLPPLPFALGAATMAASFGLGWWQAKEAEWPFWLAGVILGAGVVLGALWIEPAGASPP